MSPWSSSGIDRPSFPPKQEEKSAVLSTGIGFVVIDIIISPY
jgi:hypothetical protein